MMRISKEEFDPFRGSKMRMPLLSTNGAMNKQTKALALLSGGLDSTLAVKLILDQGINVEAVRARIYWE